MVELKYIAIFAAIMKKIILFLCLSLSVSFLAHAGGRNREHVHLPHSISIIVSDALWEQVIYHDIAGLDYSLSNPNYTYFEKNNYAHTPHMAVEYAYRFVPWFELAIQTDFQLTTWDANEITGGKTESSRNCFYNLSFIPEARFIYLRRQWVEMHSGLGVGLDINGGSEVFPGKGHSVNVLAFDLNYVGVSVGKNHWHGTFDLGGTFALLDTSTIFMASSRIFRIGLTYSF